MLELGSSRCLNLTAETSQIRERKTDSNRQMTRVFTFEFQFEFWGVKPEQDDSPVPAVVLFGSFSGSVRSAPAALVY